MALVKPGISLYGNQNRTFLSFFAFGFFFHNKHNWTRLTTTQDKHGSMQKKKIEIAENKGCQKKREKRKKEKSGTNKSHLNLQNMEELASGKTRKTKRFVYLVRFVDL